ncbi:sensor histidine kinase [Hahella ganghwensis]|uniref:sensor histidine kinase n=1 Tax=Hahella ganghwensis TaxID=286420 RepID=UPI00037E6560|nr:ATP-binding protein [Hahella ganghwensis]
MTDSDFKASPATEKLSKPISDIDPDFTLKDLLSDKEIEQLENKLSVLLNTSAKIIDACDMASDINTSYPIRYQICPVAYLVTEAPSESAKAAANLFESVLFQASRYRLAAVAHHAVVLQDFDDLQTKHQRLMESEAKYRELAVQLEHRVQEQVGQIELRQRQVYEAEKLSALAQLGAGVAHEINNPLGFIQSNMNSGKSYLREIDEAVTALRQGQNITAVSENFDLDFVISDLQTLMKETIDGVARVTRIVRDLKGFVGAETSARQQVLMHEILESICYLSHPLLEERIELTRELAEVSPIMMDKAAVCQALYAILLNAVQSIENTGKILVRCHEQNHRIFIDIEDSGCGMDTKTLGRIYEPFFTTKPVGSGTGLGLTVCRDIIQAHQGTIKVISQPGEGSRVQIEFPVTAHEPPETN